MTASITPLDAIRSVETFIVSIPRDVPYLGPLRDGEAINAKGYFVRRGNRSIYPATDMSVLVKVTGLPDAANREFRASRFPDTAGLVQRYSKVSGDKLQVSFAPQAIMMSG